MVARLAVSLLAAGAAFTAAPAHAGAAVRCPGARAAPAAGATGQATGAIACLINAERARRGLRRLHGDRDLRLLARRHSLDMVRRSYFSHVTPGGADFADRVRASGYGRGRDWHAGEALGWGTSTRAEPAVMVREWLASPPHRAILLGSDYRELGVGVAPGAPQPGLGGATYAVELGRVR